MTHPHLQCVTNYCRHFCLVHSSILELCNFLSYLRVGNYAIIKVEFQEIKISSRCKRLN